MSNDFPNDFRSFDAAALARAVAAIAEAAGSAPAEAALVAANLVEANLRGHDSHGVGMMPRYVDAIAEGGLAPNATMRVVHDAGALVRVDGQTGFGQAIGREAIALGIERARAHGVCVLGIANSHHLGRIGHWAEQALEAGLVSVHFVNVLSRPIVAPFGGTDARHGTNPFCVGIPRAGREPIVLDFATSRVAQGKTRVAYNAGEALAPGLLLDDAGRPTTDPRYGVVPPYGALLPFGEHKGSGLALVCELLGGALAGGATWHAPADGRRQVLNGMLSILVDPQAMGTAQHLASEAEAFVAWHTASPTAEGVDRVRIAGEPERETRARRLAEGVPVDPGTWEELKAAATKAGLGGARLETIARGR